MKTVGINRAEFDEFRRLQVKMRNDCHAAFSTNLAEIPWPFVTLGLTPQQLRKKIRELFPKLDQLVGIFIELPDKRPRGGRFFIDVDGAYWKDAEKKQHRFVLWKPDEPLREPIEPPSWAELRQRQMNASKLRKQ
jgi:hypothetical protein